MTRGSTQLGFSLIEVMVAAALVTIIWAGFMTIISSNYQRIMGGNDLDDYIPIAYTKLEEIVSMGYPPEEVPETDWEDFSSFANEDVYIHPNMRWRYSVEDHDPQDWMEEGSSRDNQLRNDAGNDSPYRIVILEVQKFTSDEYGDVDLSEPEGDPFFLERIMKPVPSTQPTQP